jgi:hypothetical protein
MAKKVLLIVFGAVLALIGAGLTIGGAVLLAITGGDGYLGSGTESLSTPTRALVSEPQVVDGDGFDITVRLQVSSATGDPIFVGAGPAAAVTAYLSGSSYDEVRDLEFSPVRYNTVRHEGERELPEPADQPLWIARASGTGEQTLELRLDTADYRVVVMNADASPAVDVRASFGVRVPLLRRLGLGLLIGGVLSVLVGLVLLVLGVRVKVPPRQPAWGGPPGYWAPPAAGPGYWAPPGAGPPPGYPYPPPPGPPPGAPYRPPPPGPGPAPDRNARDAGGPAPADRPDAGDGGSQFTDPTGPPRDPT